LRSAFTWMQRAHELNPDHEDTMKQLWNLERALEAQEVEAGGDENPHTLTTSPSAAHEPSRTQGEGAAQGWKSEIWALSKMPPVQHPLVYGRDASNPYYDFLYRLTEKYKPRVVVEFGTCSGGSTSYFAAGCTETKVISVDIVQHPETVKRLSVFPNVELWTYNTNDPALGEALKNEGPVDVLFIDTEHEYQQARSEFETYRSFVVPGGLLLFDDIYAKCMGDFWMGLAADTLELPQLHWSGFGACRAPA